MVDEGDSDSVQSLLATNLRRLRIARHLSLSELARATAMSKATLSSIENGKANPTVDTLAALAGALRISLPELLEDLPVPDMRVVRGASAGSGSSGRGIAQRRLDEIAGPAGVEVEVAELQVPAGENRESAAQGKGSRAHLFVLSGKLVAGPVERSTELTAGDYASFPTDVPYLFATGRHAARALLLSQMSR
jgi:XRE family transcriptional regulator, regulator of sulfur utilization